jgi:uncharacterized protein YdcH (DUF465 family)
MLAGRAHIEPRTRSFVLDQPPVFAPDVPSGKYKLTRADDGDAVHRYRRQHPLAVAVVDAAASLDAPEAELIFDYTSWGSIAESLKPLVGRSGTVVVDHLRLEGEDIEDHLLMAAITDDRIELTDDQIRRLLDLPACVTALSPVSLPEAVIASVGEKVVVTLQSVSKRQGKWFDEEMDKLDRWAEDKRAGLKADLREHDDTLKVLKREARHAASLPDKLAIQKRIKRTEASRKDAWRAYDSEARTVEQAKDAIIDDVESRLKNTHAVRRILTIRFTVS